MVAPVITGCKPYSNDWMKFKRMFETGPSRNLGIFVPNEQGDRLKRKNPVGRADFRPSGG
jgi:hypothetical protein